MGRKARKWYVVVAGQDVGVFQTWSEVASLVTGVPGALHESFNSEEEALHTFMQEERKGKTQILNSRLHHTINKHSPEPSILPNEVTNRVVPLGTERSSPRSFNSLSRRSPLPIKTHSPAVRYGHGASESPSHDSCSRIPPPRTVVRTPPDIVSYPGGKGSPLSPISRASLSSQDVSYPHEVKLSPKVKEAKLATPRVPYTRPHSRDFFLAPDHKGRLHLSEMLRGQYPVTADHDHRSPTPSISKSLDLLNIPPPEATSDPRSPWTNAKSMVNLHQSSFARPSPDLDAERHRSILFL